MEDILKSIPKNGIKFETLMEISFIDEKTLSVTLEDYVSKSKIVKVGDKYFTCEDAGLFLAIVKSVFSDHIFARIIGEDEDSYVIFSSKVPSLLEGDLIYVKNPEKSRFFLSDEKVFERIYQRSRKHIFGSCYFNGKFYKVDTLNANKHMTFYFKNDLPGLEDGDFIEASVKGLGKTECELNAIRIVAKKTDVGKDITAILVSHDVHINFDDDVKEFLNRIPNYVTDKEIIGRVDYSKESVVTIDGEDALDFDDAVSVKKTDFGYRVGVYIADVTHYVKAHSPLDDEAAYRTTSIYVADRVVPMLPKQLSNGICSLNQGERRLVLATIIDFNNDYEIINRKIEEGFIISKARLTYRQVNDLIEKKTSSIIDEELQSMLLMLYKITLKLRNDRKLRGALEIESTELRFVLDKNGIPVEIIKRQSGEGEKLIEELMILSNVTVAMAMHNAGIPILYRIHEDPPAKKMETFIKLCAKYGITPQFQADSVTPNDLLNLVASIKDATTKKTISRYLLRSLAKARYDKNNCGHFGLALDFYSHFTSPIRRYPDLLLHRAVKDYLLGDKKFDLSSRNMMLEHFGETTSTGEREATMIEREVDDLEQAQYMSKHIGEKFVGVIDGFIAQGMFLELENGVEGMLRFDLIEGDYINFNEENFCAIGRRSHKVFKLGDKIEVTVFESNIKTKKISFSYDELKSYNVKKSNSNKNKRGKGHERRRNKNTNK